MKNWRGKLRGDGQGRVEELMPRYVFLKTLEALERGTINVATQALQQGGRPWRYTPFVVTSLMAALGGVEVSRLRQVE